MTEQVDWIDWMEEEEELLRQYEMHTSYEDLMDEMYYL